MAVRDCFMFSPALLGVVLHLQGGALDPLGSVGGFATVTNALVLMLGH